MGLLATEGERRIYFEHYAGTGVPVLLLHGWGMSCRVWDTTLVALRKAGHAVVSFDQRGCGSSDKDFAEVSIAASARDAVALLDHLGIRRVVLNGWSLGGAIAVEAASQLGDRCAGVVLTAAASPRYTQAPDFALGNPPGSTAQTVALLREDRAGFLYNLTKAALIHLTRQLASELGPTRVVGIAPGLVKTDFAAYLVENFGDRLAASMPLKRLGEPEDIANLATFLVSDAASWITGETFVIDGGAGVRGT